MKKSGNRGLIVLVVILLIYFLCSIGYICYDKLYNSGNDLERNDKEIINQEVSNVVEQNKYNLSEIRCEEGESHESCTKSIDVKFNGDNHKVIIEQIKKNQELFYNISIDGNNSGSTPCFTREGGNVYDFQGSLLVFDGKYLVFAKSQFNSELVFFDKDNKIIDETVPIVNIERNINENNNIESLEFDGHKLVYYYLECDTITDTTAAYDKIELTYDGTRYSTKASSRVTDQLVGGQGPNKCYNIKTNSYQTIE